MAYGVANGMANAMASAMAKAMTGCYVRDMAHSTPLHSLYPLPLLRNVSKGLSRARGAGEC